MLIISKESTIFCLLCLCGNRKYPGSFQNKAVRIKLFLSSECPSEVRGKGFFKWTQAW